MKIQNNSSLLFIGDSITDCGRAYPVGKKNGLGNGYVSLINSLIGSIYSEKKINILNTGISGNRIIDLEARWEKDVIQLNPDWLSIMIGINDVWRHFDCPSASIQVSKEEFKKIYIKLIESVIKKVNGLVLMTPYYIEKNKNDPMREMMDEYGYIVKSLSKQYETIFVDVQKGFDNYLTNNHVQMISEDKVHPNLTGHMIIANCFLNAIEFEWK